MSNPILYLDYIGAKVLHAVVSTGSLAHAIKVGAKGLQEQAKPK